MRFFRTLSFVAAGFALVGCSEDGSKPTTPNVPPLAYVRYINAVPDTLSTTVRFVDQVQYSPMTFAAVPFRGLGQGNYQPTEAKARKIKVFTYSSDYSAAGNTNVLVDTTLTFEAGKHYTLLHAGYARAGSSPKQRLIVLEDQFPAVTGGIAVRSINAAYGIGSVDVYATTSATAAISGAPLFGNQALENVSAYQNRATGGLAFRFAAPGSTDVLGSGAAVAGIAGTSTSNPVGGANIAGTVLTGISFPASAANSAGAKFAAPGVVFFVDKQPPSTVPGM